MKRKPDLSEKNKMQSDLKLFSLKKQISGIMVFVFVFVEVMALSMILISMRHYQEDHDKRHMDDLRAYGEKIEAAVIQMNDVVGTIYSSNTDFGNLESSQSMLEKWYCMYSLLNQCQIQVRANQNLSGLFVYYGKYGDYENSYEDRDGVLYYVNEKIPFRDKEKLKHEGRNIISGMIHNYEEYVLQTENNTYYNVLLRKGASAIEGSTRLNIGIPEHSEEKAVWGIVHEEVFYPIKGQVQAGMETIDDDLKVGKTKIGKYVCYRYELSAVDINVIEILPSKLAMYVNKVHILFFFCCLFLIPVLMRIYRFVIREFSEPLEDMTHAMQQIQAGNWEIGFTVPNRIQEIENVKKAVKVMLEKIEQYKVMTYEEKLEKQKVQLQFLNLQLTPHFYMNCLKNAYYMLILQEYDGAQQFLLRLSTHFRYLLQNNASMVTIQMEMDFIKNYVELHNQMSGRQITCRTVIDEEVWNLEIPILMIQTFVENSIKYYSRNDGKNTVLHIGIRQLAAEGERYIRFRVEDNGEGYPEEMLSILNQKEPMGKQGLGIGIVNLQSRIRIQYGKKAEWYFWNEEGARSELILPIAAAEKTDEKIQDREKFR